MLAPTHRGVEIMKNLNNEQYECVICYAKIEKNQQIWTCNRCYAIFHIGCVRQWATKKVVWKCPVCRLEITKQPTPMCFCGKNQNGNQYFSAHSCGEICGKKRIGTDCPHPCTHTCHAGPCGPCTASGKVVKCYCGKNGVYIGCGEEKKKGSIHAEKCCPKCTVKIECRCYCQKQKSFAICGDVKMDSYTYGCFSCNNICGKLLDCGKHYCTLPCHPGKCINCPTSINITTCACGRTIYNRTQCSDPFEQCPNCKCTHYVKRFCRCGSVMKEVYCGYKGDILCDKVCGNTLNCGVHKCERKCCIAHNVIGSDFHQCTSICNKLLPCGHKCLSPLICSTAPPICHELCTKIPSCRHILPPHRCHFGDCPQCVTLCEKPCYCGKTSVKNVLCHIDKVSCGNVCGKPLDCGIHFCKRKMKHVTIFVVKKKEYCEHSCDFKCHGSLPCPTTPCKQLVELTCDCGMKKVKMICGSTPEHPWKSPHIECDEEHCNKINNKIQNDIKTVKINCPLWLLCLYDSCFKKSKFIEEQIITFACSINKKQMDIDRLPSLPSLLTFYVCEYYHLNYFDYLDDDNPNMKYLTIKKGNKQPILIAPTIQQQTINQRKIFKQHGKDFVANVIIYDTHFDNKNLIIHLTQISVKSTQQICAFLKKIQNSCKQKVIGPKNILLIFNDLKTLEFVVGKLQEMNGYVVREDVIIPEERPRVVYRTSDGKYTKDGSKMICQLLTKKFEEKKIIHKVMNEISAHYGEVIFEYNTTFKFLEQNDEKTTC
ncbi:Nuclear transcription factor [Entamoeba marina]